MPNPPTISGSAPPSELATLQEAKRARRLSSIPQKAQGMFKRAWAGKLAPRQCIKCFCLECNGFDRKAVTECTAYACPLFNVRPYQKG